MVYRFFVALLFTLGVFPFVAMYLFSVTWPDASFAFDQRTWLQGLFPIAIGWVVFLLPGMFPFMADRYYPWIGRITGLTAVIDATENLTRSLGTGVAKVNTNARHSLSNLPASGVVIQGLRDKAENLRRKTKSSDQSIPSIPDLDSEALVKDEVESIKPGIGDKLKAARQDPASSFRGLVTGLQNIKDQLTPSELQKTINLNHYTLSTFAHLKHILQFKLQNQHQKLSPEERGFYESIFSAIPEPPPPGAVDLAPQSLAFVYPPDLRATLMTSAAKNRMSLTHNDFVAAEHGDIERGLLILKAMILDRPVDHRIQVDNSVDDAFTGLPPHNGGALSG